MGLKKSYKHLLSAGRIGSLELKNRICMAPMGTNFSEPDGSVNERTKAYYEERARGGAGLIIVETSAINHPIGVCTPRQIGISGENYLPGLKDLTAGIHRHGSKVAIQLQHAGKIASMDIAAGRALWVASKPAPATGGLEDVTPEEIQMMVGNLTASAAEISYHELTKEDIDDLVSNFADAADLAKRAGFDGVEIHAGHGYLISMFLSPGTNRRKDEYGGTLENRARLMVEVIRAVKKRTGHDFPLWIRIDAKEFRIENGTTINDACEAVKLAETAGADAVHVTAYANPALGYAFTEAPLVHEKCGFLPFAKEIKKHISIPVIAVGRIEPEEGDRAIKEGNADFIAMGRKLIADPELPNKIEKGQEEDVRPCICCYTCVEQIFIKKSVCCAVNPAAGCEKDYPITPTNKARHVVVVGGGPAGMEAARVAALRGHRVTLCEKQQWLGGTTFLSSLVNPDNGNLSDYLAIQVNNSEIDVQSGKAVTAEYVQSLNPDVVFIAQGARRKLLDIPGADGKNVFSGDDLRSLLVEGGGSQLKKLSLLQRAVVRGGRILGATQNTQTVRTLSKIWMPLGNTVVIIGGGLVGIEMAEFLTDRGRNVTVVEESGCMGAHMAIPRRWRILHELRERGVCFITNARVESLENGKACFIDENRKTNEIKFDSVILAKGTVPNTDLYKELSDMGFDVHLLGDCRETAYIRGAIADGAFMGRKV